MYKQERRIFEGERIYVRCPKRRDKGLIPIGACKSCAIYNRYAVAFETNGIELEMEVETWKCSSKSS